MPKILVEIIAGSAEDCRIAQRGGAHRIELCAAIEMGGLTPSIGMLERSIAQTTLPIMAMVRPRTGGFNYSEEEFETMLTDVQRFREAGAKGVVFGILTDLRTFDLPRMNRIVEAAAEMETVCHRCFDAALDPVEGLEDLVELGVTRLLTSGQCATAGEGRDLIRMLVVKAEGRIEILPGSGLNPSNVREFASYTGVDQVHLSAFQSVADRSMNGVELKFNGREPWEAAYRGVDEGVVATTVANLSP